MSDNLPDSFEDHSDQAEKKGMTRSDIAFPYISLEDAVAVTRVIYENGASLSRDQIAGFMRLKSVHLRMLGSRLFGLVEERPDSKFALTDLGVSILSSDENEARASRRDAFLKVPLYLKTYETFRNRNLPVRPHGLEQTFVGFGVAPKQKDKARIAFERSANFAGFFEANKDRLIEPIISRTPTNIYPRISHEEGITHQPRSELEKKEQTSIAANEFLIKGLLDRLPPTNETWSIEDRVRWLKALSVNLEIIYGDPLDLREISIIVPDKVPRANAILEALRQSGGISEDK